MMRNDICDCPVSLSDAAVVDHWNGVITGFLSHGTQTPVHLGKVLEAAPDFAMGHAARGLFSLMMGRAELISVAREAHAAAQAALARVGAAPRERLWVQALGEWLHGRPTGAVAAMEAALRLQPRDTLSAKVCHAIRFVLGDAKGMRASVEAVLDAHRIHPMRGYLLGCHAFALEETGDYDAARRTGLQGLVHAPDDAWGLHAVAHVFDMTARPDDGIALIESHTHAWDHCNNFRYHVWWHKALLHMDQGDLDVALGLYDEQIRQEKTDDYRDIANATSLLMRLELEGMNVGDRWDELSEFSEERVEDGCLVFADLHYMLALSGAQKGAAADAMCARFARDAIRSGEMPRRVADPGLAAVAGLSAFAEGRWDQAFQNLAAARVSLQSIGGSHAQRDVFERMTIDAGLRAGRVERTAQILAQRTAQRGGHEDRFAQTRGASISRARRIAAQ